jgi:hypothetical protein
MADGQENEKRESVLLSDKIRTFSWKFKFFAMEDCPIPCRSRLSFAQINLNFGNSTCAFAFEPSLVFQFEAIDSSKQYSNFFPCAEDDLDRLSAFCTYLGPTQTRQLDQVVSEFPSLFSDKIGTVKGMICDIDLSDDIPVRSRPYQYAPPKLQILREVVQDLLDKGVICKSRSQYASPAFLVPKPHGGHRLVMDYRLVNKKVVFDSFPMPSIEHSFSCFKGAQYFSVLDLNSAYYQIPLSMKSRKLTAFCTPFGLYEFTKLPMGISIGCQVLCRVVDSLFGDVKYHYVFNFMDDLVVYSESLEEHLIHLREVFKRLESAGFTLNREKVQKRKLHFWGILFRLRE